MRLTLGIILVALVAATIWLFGRDSAGEVAEGGAAFAATQPPADTVAPTPVEVPTPSREQPPTDETPIEAREAVAAVPGGPTVELVAVRFGSETPIPGAEIGYISDPALWQSFGAEDREAISRGDLDFYRRKGLLLRTDDKGRCSVPTAEQGTSVVVTFENLFARAHLNAAQQEPQVVKLRPDHQLVVRVLDAGGVPAQGLTVTMERPIRSGNPGVWHAGTTDRDGRFVQRHSQEHAGEQQSCEVEISAGGFGVTTPKVRVDLLATPEVEVTLNLPRSGSITFELVTESGERFDLAGLEPPGLGLAMHETRPDRRSAFKSGATIRSHFDLNGRLAVRHVGLDQFYSFLISGLVSDPLIGKGPTADRPDLVVPVVIPADLVIIKGRAVDADGKPLAQRGVSVVCRFGRGMASQNDKTAADGGFLAPLPYLKPGMQLDISAMIRIQNDVDLTAMPDAPWTAKPGINDLGDLHFAPAPLLLSGKLVVPESLASIRQLSWQVEKQQGRRWESMWGEVQTRWLEDRSFEVRGLATKGTSLRLRFQRGRHLPLEPLEFTPGTKDIEIALAVAGSVTATLLVDDHADGRGVSSALSVHLNPRTPAGTGDPRTRAMRRMLEDRMRPQASGKGRVKARWRGLETGTYDLRVEGAGATEPLVSIPGIEVRGGKVVDGRLTDIDLRGRLRQITIAVTDDQGKPLTQPDALVILTDSEGVNWRGHGLKNGEVSLFIADSARVRVLAKGYLLAEVEGVRADRTIRLQRPPAVRFRVKWPFALPKGVTPQLQVTPRNAGGSTRRISLSTGMRTSALDNRLHADGAIDPDGAAVVRPMVLGPQRLRIAMDPNGRGHYVHSIKPRSVDLTGNETGEIVLDVGAESLRRALDRMKKR